MAKFSQSALVGEVAGKVGGVVFQRGRNAQIIRLRVNPINPATATQQAARAALTAASRQYSAFNSMQLEAWRTFAESIQRTDPISGKQYNPSAISVYTELGTKFLQVTPGGTLPLNPPADAYVPPTIVVGTPTYDPSADEVSVTAAAATPAGSTVEILWQKTSGLAELPRANKWKTLGFHTFVTGTLTHTFTDVTEITSGGAVWFAYRYVKTATGEMGPIVSMGVGTNTE